MFVNLVTPKVGAKHELLFNKLTSALLADIRLGWKSLPRTNTLAYFKKTVNYDYKKFYSIAKIKSEVFLRPKYAL
jgi:hypothetical protein